MSVMRLLWAAAEYVAAIVRRQEAVLGAGLANGLYAGYRRSNDAAEQLRDVRAALVEAFGVGLQTASYQVVFSPCAICHHQKQLNAASYCQLPPLHSTTWPYQSTWLSEGVWQEGKAPSG